MIPSVMVTIIRSLTTLASNGTHAPANAARDDRIAGAFGGVFGGRGSARREVAQGRLSLRDGRSTRPTDATRREHSECALTPSSRSHRAVRRHERPVGAPRETSAKSTLRTRQDQDDFFVVERGEIVNVLTARSAEANALVPWHVVPSHRARRS